MDICVLPAFIVERGFMFAALVVATVLDLGLGLLMISVSGFVLQGVNNTGPMMPEALFFGLMVALCFGAPIAAWSLRRRLASPTLLAIACSPLLVTTGVLLLEPMFV
jgi:hypothetical protein